MKSDDPERRRVTALVGKLLHARVDSWRQVRGLTWYQTIGEAIELWVEFQQTQEEYRRAFLVRKAADP